jgi:hypothetical protein
MTLFEKFLFGFFVVGLAIPFNGINYPIYIYCGLFLLFFKLVLREFIIKTSHLFSYFILLFFLLWGYEDSDFYYFIIINIISLFIIDNYSPIKKNKNIAVCIFTLNSLVIVLEVVCNISFLTIPETLFIERRHQGFSLYGGSILSVIIFFVLASLERIDLNKKIILIFFLINIFALLFVGRVGLYMYCIHTLFKLRKLNFHRIFILVYLGLFCFILLMLFDIGNLRAFDVIYHFSDHGNFQTSGVSQFLFQLETFYDDFEFSLFGNGNFGMRDNESKELGFDSALLRIYNGSGLIGLFSYICIYIKSGKYILLFFNIKEFLFYSNPVVYFLYERRKNH